MLPRLRTTLARRQWPRYMSAGNTTGAKQMDDPRQKILDAALEQVNRRGWTEEALAAGAVQAGFPPVTHGLFPRGSAELAEFWMDRGNTQLEQFLQQSTKKGQELVVEAIFHRLKHGVPYIRSWPQAMATGLYPDNVTTTMQKLHAIPELICNAADQSEQQKVWQERKTALGAIFASAELYMLTDYSEGYKDTYSFVQSRVRDSLLFQEKAGSSMQTIQAVATGVGSILTAAAQMVSPPLAQPDIKKPEASTESFDEFDIVDIDTDVGLHPVKLPSGLSLFGLLGLSRKEAVDIVQNSNPDFTVLVTNANDESTEPQRDSKLVRLLVDDEDIVLDVLRS